MFVPCVCNQCLFPMFNVGALPLFVTSVCYRCFVWVLIATACSCVCDQCLFPVFGCVRVLRVLTPVFCLPVFGEGAYCGCLLVFVTSVCSQCLGVEAYNGSLLRCLLPVFGVGAYCGSLCLYPVFGCGCLPFLWRQQAAFSGRYAHGMFALTFPPIMHHVPHEISATSRLCSCTPRPQSIRQRYRCHLPAARGTSPSNQGTSVAKSSSVDNFTCNDTIQPTSFQTGIT